MENGEDEKCTSITLTEGNSKRMIGLNQSVTFRPVFPGLSFLSAYETLHLCAGTFYF